MKISDEPEGDTPYACSTKGCDGHGKWVVGMITVCHQCMIKFDLFKGPFDSLPKVEWEKEEDKE